MEFEISFMRQEQSAMQDQEAGEQGQNLSTEHFRKLYQKGISLLARREHSRQEISGKLQPLANKHDCEELIGTVIDQLVESGYLSDQRFAEMLVRSRYEKGQGPMKVRQELQMKGVDGDLIRDTLEQFEGDWFALAASVRSRRFSEQAPQDQKERARQMRFLGGRGFSGEQIKYALSSEAF